METVETVLLIILILDAVALAVLVLMQQGKGADIGAAFGSGSSNTLFGSGGSASFLTKATVWLSVGFFVVSFALAYTAKQRAVALGQIELPKLNVGTPADAIDATDATDALDADLDALEFNEPATDGADAAEPEAQDTDIPPEELTPDPEPLDSDIPEL